MYSSEEGKIECSFECLLCNTGGYTRLGTLKCHLLISHNVNSPGIGIDFIDRTSLWLELIADSKKTCFGIDTVTKDTKSKNSSSSSTQSQAGSSPTVVKIITSKDRVGSSTARETSQTSMARVEAQTSSHYTRSNTVGVKIIIFSDHFGSSTALEETEVL